MKQTIKLGKTELRRIITESVKKVLKEAESGGWIGIIIGIAVTIILSFIKEQFLDSFFDWKDICAASIGSVISVLIYLFFTIFL